VIFWKNLAEKRHGPSFRIEATDRTTKETCGTNMRRRPVYRDRKTEDRGSAAADPKSPIVSGLFQIAQRLTEKVAHLRLQLIAGKRNTGGVEFMTQFRGYIAVGLAFHARPHHLLGKGFGVFQTETAGGPQTDELVAPGFCPEGEGLIVSKFIFESVRAVAECVRHGSLPLFVFVCGYLERQRDF
jgi:hypothetical protein